MALIYLMWKLRMHFYEKQVAKETSKSLNVPILFIYAFFGFGEYKIMLLAKLASTKSVWRV